MNITTEIGFVPALDRLIGVVEMTNAKAATGEVVFTPKRGKCLRVLRVSPKIEAIDGGHVTDMVFHEGKALFFLELSESCAAIKAIVHEGRRPFEATFMARPLRPERMDQYIHILGAYAFLVKDYREANRLLALAEQRSQEASQELDPESLKDSFKRYFKGRKFIGEGLKDQGQNRCVMNVIRALIEDPGNVVFIGTQDYPAEEERRPDPRLIVAPNDRTLQAVSYTSHGSRRNFSFLCLKDARLRLRGDAIRPVRVWRTYHVIRDGEPCISGVHASLSRTTYQQLKDAGLISASRYKGGQVYWVSWAGLPLFSSAWANPKVLGLIPLLKEEATLKYRLTVLNKRCKETARVGARVPRVGSGSSTWIPIYRERAGTPIRKAASETEQCRVRLLRYKPDGYAVNHLTFEQAEAEAKRVRRRLKIVRFLIRTMFAAMDKVGSTVIEWGAAKATKRGKQEQITVFDGARIKLTRWKEKPKK